MAAGGQRAFEASRLRDALSCEQGSEGKREEREKIAFRWSFAAQLGAVAAARGRGQHVVGVVVLFCRLAHCLSRHTIASHSRARQRE